MPSEKKDEYEKKEKVIAAKYSKNYDMKSDFYPKIKAEKEKKQLDEYQQMVESLIPKDFMKEYEALKVKA